LAKFSSAKTLSAWNARCLFQLSDEITKIDKELLAARYQAAISEEFGALARFLDTTTEAMLVRSRAANRVISQLHEIASEYDFEMELLDLIRREGGAALTAVGISLGGLGPCVQRKDQCRVAT
jgi:hypothetical protein